MRGSPPSDVTNRDQWIGAKPFHEVGKYEGSAVFGDVVTTATWYIVHKKDTEPLIPGTTAERFGTFKFNSDPSQKEAKIQRIIDDQKTSKEKHFG